MCRDQSSTSKISIQLLSLQKLQVEMGVLLLLLLSVVVLSEMSSGKLWKAALLCSQSLVPNCIGCLLADHWNSLDLLFLDVQEKSTCKVMKKSHHL